MKVICTSLFFVFLFGISIHAQKPSTSKTLTPIEFSDRMSDITDSLYRKGTAWGVQFKEANKQHNFSTLKPYRVAVQTFINNSLQNLKTMPDVKDSKALRLAMIDFLTYENKMVIEGFMPIEKIKSNATEDEINKALQGLQDLATVEGNELKKVSVEQQAYAKANGFRIETEEEAGSREQSED